MVLSGLGGLVSVPGRRRASTAASESIVSFSSSSTTALCRFRWFVVTPDFTSFLVPFLVLLQLVSKPMVDLQESLLSLFHTSFPAAIPTP